MTITAKYSGRCQTCGGAIVPGQQIEWTKGAPARHVRCGGQRQGGSGSSSGAPQSDSRTIVAARATHKGRPCYIVGREIRGRTRWDDEVRAVATRDGRSVLLCSPDGARQWWAPKSEVEIRTTYRRPQSIASLRAFRESVERGDVRTCYMCRSASCPGAHGGLCDED